MSKFYGASQLESLEEYAKSDEVLEMMIVDDVIRGTKEEIREFCESDECKILQEKQVLKKPTMMRLSKEDDKKRRIKLMAYQLAKADNYTEWHKLKTFTAKRKECIGKIMQKYGARAAKLADIAQKNYVKIAAKMKDSKKK